LTGKTNTGKICIYTVLVIGFLMINMMGRKTIFWPTRSMSLLSSRTVLNKQTNKIQRHVLSKSTFNWDSMEITQCKTVYLYYGYWSLLLTSEYWPLLTQQIIYCTIYYTVAICMTTLGEQSLAMVLRRYWYCHCFWIFIGFMIVVNFCKCEQEEFLLFSITWKTLDL
jgi:hypothetical protein